jgi:CelD/BcsL family acetyltransferase involved in cellulose biosynthesis
MPSGARGVVVDPIASDSESFFTKLPADLSGRLPELYRSAFSVVGYFDAFQGVAAPAGLLLGTPERPRHVLCYTVDGRRARLLNELVAIERADVERLAQRLFARHPEVRRIRLIKVATNLDGARLPHLRLPGGSDHVIALPPDDRAYEAALGASTRRNLKHWSNKLRRARTDLRFETLDRGAITSALVARVVEMNRARMRVKARASGLDEAYQRSLSRFLGDFGVATIIRFGDEVVAGTLCSRVAGRFFLHVIAHDPRHDALRLGHLCLRESIRVAIAERATAFHLLWGDFDYKRHLLGVRERMFDWFLYRTRLDKWRDLPTLVERAKRIARSHLLERRERVRSARRSPAAVG